MKLGSLLQSDFQEGDCDICIETALSCINSYIRTAYPDWFDGEGGAGNLLAECIDLHTKKIRSELKMPAYELYTKQKHIWFVKCGFCDEPFGICAAHLKEIWLVLEGKTRQNSSGSV